MNTLATFQKSALKNAKEVIASDQNNADLSGECLTGKALCLPVTIGSTTGGLVIQTVCAMKIAPACFLFSEHVDSLAASGIVLARVWEGSNVIAVDENGGYIGSARRRHRQYPLNQFPKSKYDDKTIRRRL